MVLGKLALLAHIHDNEFFASIQLRLNFLSVGFSHTFSRLIHNLQEPRRVLMSRGGLLLNRLGVYRERQRRDQSKHKEKLASHDASFFRWILRAGNGKVKLADAIPWQPGQ
jgi:hypothetical protein